MKKMLAVLLGVILAIGMMLLFSASAEKLPEMYVEPAQLTQEEQRIARLLDQGETLIYDFCVDSDVRKMSINCYELINGEWVRFIGGGGYDLQFDKGRFALQFDDLTAGLRVALDCGGTLSASKYTSEPENGGLSSMTSRLSGRKEVVYEAEVPLAIQIATGKTEIRSFAPEFYFAPEEFAPWGHDHIYAVTVSFSTEPLV